MRIGTIAFLLGCLALQHCADLPPPVWAVLLPPVIFLLFRAPSWLRPPAWLAAGFLWALLRATLDLTGALDPSLEGADVTAEGIVAGLPERQGDSVRFEFEVTNLSVGRWTGRVRVGWYRNAPDLHVGERWRLAVRLKRPHGFMNPGGFDYEGWLYQHGIRATGSVQAGPANRRLDDRIPQHALDRLRQRIDTALARVLHDSPWRGVVAALVIGAEYAVTPAQWQVFTRTGTTHLVAISGLHITLIAGLVMIMVARLWTLLPRAALGLPAPKAGLLAALLAATAYALLAGFSIPTRRALVMLAVALGARFGGRSIGMSRTLALALLAVLIVDPAAPLAAGFWLSFGAVAVLLYGMQGRIGGWRGWRSWGRTQGLVALGLLPLTLMLFQRASLIAPLANVVAVPWISLLVTPLALLGALLLPCSDPLAVLSLRGAAWLLDLLWPVLEFCAQLPGALWFRAPSAPWVGLGATAGAVLLLAPRGLPGRWLGLLLFLPLLLIRPETPPPGAVWFTLLDVGQGLAAVVRTAQHTLVFDTGPRFSDSFDTGGAVVLPYLRAQGVDAIDLLLVSHGDNDHIGGADAVLAGMPVAAVLTSVPERFTRPVVRCRAGQGWTWDGVEFRLLHPDDRHDWSDNDGGCVLHVAAPGGSVLLSADIEAPAERYLLATQPQALRASILVAPHHGSRTSSTRDFIAAVAPRHVLFPVGYRNRYGFPRPEVVRRYAAAGAQRLDSAVEGAITFRIDPRTGIGAPARDRRAARRFWNWRPAEP